MRRLPPIALLALIALGCDSTATTSLQAPQPRAEISDGANAGNPHFFFLPPVITMPSYTGSFDAGANPAVSICEWNAPGNTCGTIVAEFESGASPDGSVAKDAVGQLYHVNWRTDECLSGPCTLDPARTYRIRVFVGLVQLGYADVGVVSNGSQLKNVQTNEYIGLVNGRTLPIKFRIEQGAVSVLTGGGSTSVGSSGGNVTTADGTVGLAIPAGALAGTTSISASVVESPGAGIGAWAPSVDFGPDGASFAQPVTLTMAFKPESLPENVPPDYLGLVHFDGIGWEAVPGSTVNLADNTVSAPITHFSTYSISIIPSNYGPGGSLDPEPTTLTIGQETRVQSTVLEVRIESRTYYYYVKVLGRKVLVSKTVPQGYVYPAAGMSVTWSSSAPGVASMAAGPTSTSATGTAISPPILAHATGTTGIRSSFGSLTSSELVVTVLPSLSLSVINSILNQGDAWTTDGQRDVGIAQQFQFAARIPAAGANDALVTLTHTNPTVTSLFGTLLIRGGDLQSGRNNVVGLAAGRDTIIATAPGYGPDTLVVDVAAGTIQVPEWPASLVVGDSVLMHLWSMNPPGTSNDWRPALTHFTLAGSPNLRFSDVVNPLLPACAASGCLFHPPWGYNTQGFYMKAVAAGEGTVTVQSAPNYLPYTNSVTITGPAFETIGVTPNPAGVVPGGTVQLTGTPRNAAGDPVTGVTLTWSSANAAVAAVDGSGLVTGVANGTVLVTASSGGISGSTTVRVGTPTIYAAPGSLEFPVQQGQVAQAQIAISNSGGGVLSGLQAFSFSNYFNGSPAPWVTASFNTTTAPATLTITAAPGVTIGAGVHQLRFTVSAPGASNSPYTFYSIKVTVIAAGVTPVNATIVPNPTSLAFSAIQGQASTAQIAITNSGTDPLTNLSAGSFSNYYNGSPAPWVTASFNTTTAPATLTVTAAPGTSIPLGTHRLRFDVMSPGATNSPYSFYTINVTVEPSHWSTMAPMPTARKGLSAAVVGSTLYAIGGSPATYDFAAFSTVEAYDPVANAWSPRTAMPLGRTYSSTTVAGGLIYVIGGWTGNLSPVSSMYVYDPAADSWSQGPNAPHNISLGAAFTVNGTIYVTNGYAGGYQSQLDRFDPGTQTWTALAPMPHVHAGPAGSGVINGKLYIAGGEGSQGTLDIYDPATNTWASGAPLPQPQIYGTSAVIGGKLYLFSGAVSNTSNATADVLVYDPITNTWSRSESGPNPRNLPGGAFVAGRMYVLGGTTAASVLLATMDAYLP